MNKFYQEDLGEFETQKPFTPALSIENQMTFTSNTCYCYYWGCYDKNSEKRGVRLTRWLSEHYWGLGWLPRTSVRCEQSPCVPATEEVAITGVWAVPLSLLALLYLSSLAHYCEISPAPPLRQAMQWLVLCYYLWYVWGHSAYRRSDTQSIRFYHTLEILESDI